MSGCNVQMEPDPTMAFSSRSVTLTFDPKSQISELMLSSGSSQTVAPTPTPTPGDEGDVAALRATIEHCFIVA